MSTRANRAGLPRGIERVVRGGLVALIVLLPFHAFAVTAIGAAFGWTTADSIAPAAVLLQSWKEVLIAVLVILVGISALLERRLPFRLLPVDWIILALFVLAGLHGALGTTPIGTWALGFRTDFAFFLVYAVARSIPWDDASIRRVLRWLGWTLAVVLVAGIVIAFLPKDALVAIGYSPYESSWVPGKPLPPYHGLAGEGRRLMSTLSGPNQYGAWLLLAIGLLAGAVSVAKQRVRALLLALLGAAVLSLVFTASRAAYLGLVAAGAAAVTLAVPAKRRWMFHVGAFAAVGAAVIVLLGFFPDAFDRYVLHGASTQEHWHRMVEGARIVAAHPGGLGLGAAGPVSTRVLGDGNGIVSENWYLQIAEELGIVAAFLVLAMLWLFFRLAWKLARAARDPGLRTVARGASIATAALAVHALFLHTFADNTPLAYSFFALLGIVTERSVGYVKPTSILKNKLLHLLEGADREIS